MRHKARLEDYRKAATLLRKVAFTNEQRIALDQLAHAIQRMASAVEEDGDDETKEQQQ